MKTTNPCKVITGSNTVMSYLNVNEPKPSLSGGLPKYSVSAIIPKSDTVTVDKIRAAIRAAYEQGREKLRGSDGYLLPLENLKLPLRDGDLERPGDEVYRNAWFINASSTSRPGVVNGNLVPITDTSQLYSGIIGRVSITFYAFNVNGSRGIAAGLNNIQKLADGRPLGARSRPEDDFADAGDLDDESGIPF